MLALVLCTKSRCYVSSSSVKRDFSRNMTTYSYRFRFTSYFSVPKGRQSIFITRSTRSEQLRNNVEMKQVPNAM